jgi:glycosyltransferase involved in cell wall biosynthesis
MNVAMLLSCGSFEGFFGGVQGQTVESYLSNYRNDWCWYYGAGLVRNGIQPILYIPSLNQTGRYETDVGISVRFLQLDAWYRPMEKVWLKRLSRTNPFSLYADERLNTAALMRPLHAGLAQDNIDLLYVQEYWSGRFDHIVARVDIPVTAADHGGVSRGVLKWFKRRSFAATPAVYCQTVDECAIVSKFGGRPRLQPNGCDTSEFFPLPDGQRSKTILTVARLTNRQKRTSDLIEALALLPDDWTLDVVGTGPDLGQLQRCAARAGVTSRVRFHGFVSRATVRDLLRTCGVYAMPSANEAVAIAALEAMGCGAAVVLSRIRAFEVLVQDDLNGMLVEVGNRPAMAQAILHAWSNRDRLGSAAVETVRQRFDTDRLYRELAQSLRSFVTPREAIRPLPLPVGSGNRPDMTAFDI